MEKEVKMRVKVKSKLTRREPSEEGKKQGEIIDVTEFPERVLEDEKNVNDLRNRGGGKDGSS